MKKIVIYNSSTGFTKKYAEWIAEELNCKVMDLKSVTQSMVSEYDSIVYGGWVMGNMITGLNDIRKMKPKDIVVYAVGSMPKISGLEDEIKEKNLLGDIPFFYMQGGFHFEQLNFFKRTLLKAIKKSISKKVNKTETDLFMEQNLGKSFDGSDIKNIEPLVKWANGRT